MEKHFASICESPIWDRAAVYSASPDFTFCLRYTLITWLPCALLWFAAPCWIFMLTKDYNVRIRLSWLTWTKTVLILALIVVQFVELVQAWLAGSSIVVLYMTPLVLIATYALATLIIHYERARGHRYSVLLFIFWLVMFMVALVSVRSEVLIYLDDERRHLHNELRALLSAISFVCVTLSLALASLTEKHVKNFDPKMHSPEFTSSLLSKLTFWWINPLITTGYKRELTRADLWDIDYRERSEYVTHNMEREWRPKATKYIRAMREAEKIKEKAAKSADMANGSSHVSYHRKDGDGDDDEKVALNGTIGHEKPKAAALKKKNDDKTHKLSEPSLGLCMANLFVFKMIGIVAIKVSHDLLNFARPILLDKLISYIKDREQRLIVGLFYIGLLCVTSLAQTLIMQHYYQAMFLVGNRIKIGLMNMIYKKSLMLSTSARKTTTVGEMTTLLTSNAQQFEFGCFHLVGMLSTPLQIAICTFMLYRYLGAVATFAGLASMLVILPLNSAIAKRTKKLRLGKYKLQDARVKMINELLAGIRVIKFYGWENSFQALIRRLRDNEIRNLLRTELLSTLSGFTWSLAPFLVGAVSFAVYLLVDERNKLDPNTAFVSLTLFGMLRFPLNFLPYIIQGLIQINVSVTRIRRFLLLDELDESDIGHTAAADAPAVDVNGVSFAWNQHEAATLNNVQLSVKRGQLVAIVGKVGCGKSSLLLSLLGEMHKISGDDVDVVVKKKRLNMNGTTAYVAQLAWIQNATIRNNITFGLPMDEARYARVLRACSLMADLEMMAAGDETEIGEKGINLSGGQKQRISLARALYADADIYLLDDPLSAVDAHVGKAIFDEVIGPNGLLKDKTRLFVTNSLSFLPQCHTVVMLEAGAVAETGSYDELLKLAAAAAAAKSGASSSRFAEFVKSFIENNETNQELVANGNAAAAEEQEKVEKSKEAATQPNSGFVRQVSQKEAKAAKLLESRKAAGEKLIEKEKIQSGNVKPSVIIEYLKTCRLSLCVVFLMLLLGGHACDMGSNYWLSDWSNDEAVATTESHNAAKYRRLAIYSALGFSKSFILMLSNLCFVALFIQTSQLFHKRLLVSVLRCPLRFFESTPMGRIVNRFTKDIEATESSIPSSIKSLVECLLSMTSTFVIIASSTPWFLAALVPIAIAYIGVQRYFIPSNRQLKRLQSASRSPIFSHFSETQSGVTTIRAYRSQEAFTRRMQTNIDESFVYYYSTTVSNRWLALRLEILGNVITIAAAFFAIISRDTISAGLAGLSISISLSISSNLNWFVRTCSEFEANITSVERIKEYMDLPHEPEWESTPEKKPSKEWPPLGHIRFANYFLKYRDELDHVLRDLSFDIQPGEKIGIVGRTGAGKSSLTLALFRMIEYSQGRIVIDDVDISTIGLHDLRHKLTIIPQDPMVFSETIKMNLDPFGEHTEDELWSALELANLKDFLMKTDEKLEFKCSEGGENLSVGQRQLICLARALLRRTKILILDEATASIDHNTDEIIQRTIRSHFSHSTVLTIAHRLNTIMDSSRIMVLDKGRIVEFDTPQSLLANKNGIFNSMAQSAWTTATSPSKQQQQQSD